MFGLTKKLDMVAREDLADGEEADLARLARPLQHGHVLLRRARVVLRQDTVQVQDIDADVCPVDQCDDKGEA